MTRFIADPLAYWIAAHALAFAWYSRGDGFPEYPGWLQASVWLTAVVVPILRLDSSPLAGLFLVAFVLTLAVQMGRVSGPGAPVGYRPPGESRE